MNSASQSGKGRLRVGISLLTLVGRTGGAETYLRNLVASLSADSSMTLYIYAPRSLDTSAFTADFGVIVRQLKLHSIHPAERVLLEQIWVPYRAKRDKLDALIMPGNQALILPSPPQIVTIHDCHPHFYREQLPGYLGRTKRLMRTVNLFLATRRANILMVDSDFTRREVEKYYPRVDPCRLRVVPLGSVEPRARPADTSGVLSSFGLRQDRYVLCVAFTYKHKNLERLVAAWERLPRPFDHDCLVLVGNKGNGHVDLMAALDASSVRPRIHLLEDFVSATDLEHLYSGARLVVVPSLYEGFGFPVLEAFRAGTPVACARAASLPEIAGDSAVLFDPLDVKDIAAAIQRLIENDALCKELGERGRRRAAEYSWPKVGVATRSAVHDALAL